MSEDKSVFKPIFIGVATTVLTTVILYYLGFEKKSSPPNALEGDSGQTSPNVPPLKVADQPAVDADFERRKQATLFAWNKMQDIDATVTALNSQTYQSLAYSYGVTASTIVTKL